MNEHTARNGFKTFILTLGISILFFGAIYFLVNSATDTKESIEDNNVQTSNSQASVLATTDSQGSVDEEQPTVFAEISKNKPDVKVKAVLAGATQSTQSTVPETGSTGITFGFMMGMSLLSLAVYIIAKGPRKSALASFEEDVTR